MRYLFEYVRLANVYGERPHASLDPPAGYVLHSWRHAADANGEKMMLVCWQRQEASFIQHLPVELAGPAMQWMRQWLTRIM